MIFHTLIHLLPPCPGELANGPVSMAAHGEASTPEIAPAPMGAGPQPFLAATRTCPDNCGNTNWAGCSTDCLNVA